MSLPHGTRSTLSTYLIALCAQSTCQKVRIYCSLDYSHRLNLFVKNKTIAFYCKKFIIMSKINSPHYLDVCVCVSACVCVCMCVFVCVCIHVYMCICLYVYVYVYVCTHVYIYIYTCVCVCMYSSITLIHHHTSFQPTAALCKLSREFHCSSMQAFAGIPR